LISKKKCEEISKKTYAGAQTMFNHHLGPILFFHCCSALWKVWEQWQCLKEGRMREVCGGIIDGGAGE
jgi:hypothetical protein